PGDAGADLVEEDESQAYPEVSSDFLLQLITELPLGYRTVFNFYVMENYSHKQIAEMLDCSENTSKSQLSKARAWLKKRILEQENHKSYGKKAASFR
ncbi:MAG: sigma-70 region 4 domain-containing protein, partial [Bacteroidota bacterium]